MTEFIHEMMHSGLSLGVLAAMAFPFTLAFLARVAIAVGSLLHFGRTNDLG